MGEEGGREERWEVEEREGEQRGRHGAREGGEIGEKAFQKQTTLEVVTTHQWIQEHCCPLC